MTLKNRQNAVVQGDMFKVQFVYLRFTLSKSGFTVSFCFMTGIYRPVSQGKCSNFELL